MSKPVLRVGNDWDGCYDSFSDGVKDTMDVLGHGHLWKSGPTKGSYWNYFEDWGWTFEQFKEVVDYGVDNRLIFTGHWRENAIETVKRIQGMGHKFIVITDRFFGSNPENSHRNTREALERAGIELDELHFTKDKTSVPVDTMVEDKLENYDALIANGTPTWLINRSWNYVPGGDARNRINSVVDYADHIEAITHERVIDLTFA
jgi:hypothetical protein